MFANFKNLEEMIELDYCNDESSYERKSILLDELQFYRVVLLLHKGSPVAAGMFQII